jgi:hypothetical protein
MKTSKPMKLAGYIEGMRTREIHTEYGRKPEGSSSLEMPRR